MSPFRGVTGYDRERQGATIGRARVCRGTAKTCKTKGISMKKPEIAGVLEVVARPGFEPGQTDPESVVLPLHHRAEVW